jgi:hypothetical protein
MSIDTAQAVQVAMTNARLKPTIFMFEEYTAQKQNVHFASQPFTLS